MKRLFIGLMFTGLVVSAAEASSINKVHQGANRLKASDYANNSKFFGGNGMLRAQQNLIGEVTAIDQSGGKITVKSEAGASVSVTTGEKTAFRRIQPGQTSITDAEQITMAEIKVGDRVLVPGGVVNEQTAVRMVVIMARQAINAQREQERETRRARTVNGRITALNPEKKEIIIQSRGRAPAATAATTAPTTAAAATPGGAETLTVSASGNVKFLRYAPDSLKVSDAVAGSFTDLRVGDQIRTVGDRSPDGTRITAEEIISGSIIRTVGSIVEVNAARGEVVVKNGQTGQLMTVAVGKNTTLRRISEDVAKKLKESANQRAERRRDRSNQQTSGNSTGQQTQASQTDRQNRRENRRENRNANGGGGQQGQGNRGWAQQFENLPAVTVAELKKGDAVLITATGGTAADNSRVTAVSIVTGDADLQQALQRTQGGRNASSPNSPGLPGNVGGGNSADDDDEPRN